MSQAQPQPGQLILGRSTAMQEVERRIERVARTATSVMILGESGTGKERVAAEIHARSSRAREAWVPVNCAGFAPENADSELFGHAKGAFTGALAQRDGVIRRAEGGTIFLDEVGTLDRQVQGKLLRTLDEGRIRPLGDDRDLAVNVRFIAATNEDVEAKIMEASWRRDFRNRFGFTIVVPPLRERPEDIEDLALHFVRLHRSGEGRNSRADSLSDAALDRLREHAWQGNARELLHAVQGALAASAAESCEELGVHHFELSVPPDLPKPSDGVAATTRALDALATSLIDDLEAGRLPAQTIDTLVRRCPEVSLKASIAEVFFSRFKAEERAEKAKTLFGYTSPEAVRRFLVGRGRGPR